MVDRINSEMIYTVKSKKFGIIGYLVIDRLIDGRSFGGVRIIPEIPLEELQAISRSMTYKCAFVGMKMGGAKSTIMINEENEKYRKDIISEFGRRISPFVKNGMYFPVMDMGISINELQIIFDNAGYKCDTCSWKNLSHEYTAYSCFYATLSALEKKNIHIKDATFAVQGLGSVGCGYAKLMCKAGARLVAFSNKYGGLINDNGFDIDDIIQDILSKGDNFILERSDKNVSRESVLEQDVTILLPAANTFVINDENYKRIKADIIVCAANAPISHETERLLKNKIVITDFIANCGGVLGSVLDDYVSNDVILKIMSTFYKRKVGDLIDQSLKSEKPLLDVAIDDIEKRVEEMLNTRSDKRSTEFIVRLLSNSFMKRSTSGYMSKRYISKYQALWG